MHRIASSLLLASFYLIENEKVHHILIAQNFYEYYMLGNIEIHPNIMVFVTLDKIGIPNLNVRIDWHGGQLENSDKDSRDPSRFRLIVL